MYLVEALEHDGCYAIVLSISKPLPICLLLTSILFCRKRYLPKILWKYWIFLKNRQKRTYFKINNSFCSFFLSELSQLVIFRCFSTFLLSNLTYLVAVLLKNCPWKVAWLWNSQASRTSTLTNLLSLFKSIQSKKARSRNLTNFKLKS